ncbi:hypothetical protein Tsubulata_033761 [Turnera subulata]|uniref:RRM domain-containing protein n=1 Tax=Turnera subulata TaxID=218843 RepID=A0A9Q0FSE5_9ROSI|nr:hypothetical protein Tsubulata_033761 [Turnera subulata]
MYPSRLATLSSQPMSPGLPGRQPPFTRSQNTIPNTFVPPNVTFTSHTNPNSHPYLYDFHRRTQLPITTSSPPVAQPNPKPCYFSKWSRKTIERAIEQNQVISVYLDDIPQRWTPTDVHLLMNRYAEVLDVFIPQKEVKKHWTPTDVHLLMNRYAEVLDIFIPQKKSRAGKRFAFVRFRNNVEISSLLDNINSMHAEDVNFCASIARARNQTMGSTRSHGGIAKNLKGSKEATIPFVDNRSFADVARVPSSGTEQLPNKISTTFLAKVGVPTWFDSCALGVKKKPMPLKCLMDLFPIEESPVVSIIPLGGVSFLFRFQSTSSMNKLVTSKPIWFNQLFELFRPWKDGDAAFNRLCWVLVKGTPPVAWTEEFFSVLVSGFGSMVDWSPETRSMARFDGAKILVLTKSNAFINKELSVKFGDKSFKVGIIESQHDPLDWTWSKPSLTVCASPSGNDVVAGVVSQQSPSNQPRSPRADAPSQSPSFTHNPNQHGVKVLSSSDDPFNLRPIVNGLDGHDEPTQQSSQAQTSMSTPSEATAAFPQNGMQNIPLTINTPQQPFIPSDYVSNPGSQESYHMFGPGSPVSAHMERPTPVTPLPLVPYESTPPSTHSQPKTPSPYKPLTSDCSASSCSINSDTILSSWTVSYPSSPTKTNYPPFHKAVEHQVIAILKNLGITKFNKVKYINKNATIVSIPETRIACCVLVTVGFQLVDVLLVLALFWDAPSGIKASSHCRWDNSADIRPHSVFVTKFGAVGVGVTLNTKAFQNAIFYLNSFPDKGGAKL